MLAATGKQRAGLLLFGFAALSAATTAKAADNSVTHTSAGAWISSDFHDTRNPGCSIGGPGSMPGSRLIMGASKAKPDPINLVIHKTGWTIPVGVSVSVRAEFSDGASIVLLGTGKHQDIEFSINAEMLKPWVHQLTANASMRLSFGGTEPSWDFDLAGTSAVVNAMGDCFREHQVTGLAPPFDWSAVASLTQPFGAPAPAPQSPSSPTMSAQPPEKTSEPPPDILAAPPSTPSTSTLSAQHPSSPDTIIMQWSGTTEMQTRPFHADAPWELQWTNGNGFFGLDLHSATDSAARPKSITVSARAADSSSYQPAGGDFYLEITASTPWTVRAVSLGNTGNRNAAASEATPQLDTTGTEAPSIGRGRQDAFIAAIEVGRRQFDAASNDMAKGGARPLRAQALCRALPSPSISDWFGTVSQLTTNGDGKGVLAIEIGPKLYLKTWNNALSDSVDGTMIDPASSLFAAASAMHVGEHVRFSATLIPNATDCFKEASVSMSGSIDEPEFIIRLTRIKAVP